jgi:PPOX class probable F420-dependent enzyme
VLAPEDRAFLLRHRVARLATADRAGAPHVIPVCYAVADDALYFVVDAKPKRATGRGLKRMRNLAENPRVALVVDDWDEDWSKLAYLLVHGEAAVVDDDAERTLALGLLRARYPQYEQMTLEGAAHPVVRITVTGTHRWRAAF